MKLKNADISFSIINLRTIHAGTIMGYYPRLYNWLNPTPNVLGKSISEREKWAWRKKGFRQINGNPYVYWWAIQDLNLWLPPCEGGTLTTELIALFPEVIPPIFKLQLFSAVLVWKANHPTVTYRKKYLLARCIWSNFPQLCFWLEGMGLKRCLEIICCWIFDTFVDKRRLRIVSQSSTGPNKIN